jgi:hypothetical protein
MLSKLYYDFTPYTASGTVNYFTEDVPIDNSTQRWAGPGGRWRHSMVGETNGSDCQNMLFM